MKTQRFGVEIEMTGITRNQAAQAIANYFGTSVNFVGGGYDKREVKDSTGRKWSVVSDSSIHAQKKSATGRVTADGSYRVEFVTPILRYEDIETLQNIVRALRKAGAFVNDSCGIHIHIDAANHNATTLKKMINLMAAREPLLYQALAIKPRRQNYCKPVKAKTVQLINQHKKVTMQDIKSVWYVDFANPNHEMLQHYSQSRYYGLNLHSVFNKGTVEFRCFNSTLHAGEVKAYIQLCLAISHQGLIQRNCRPAAPVTDNPKYTFRCWLLRMGLIGDEFETCRLHLLKNLPGNAAWRHPEEHAN